VLQWSLGPHLMTTLGGWRSVSLSIEWFVEAIAPLDIHFPISSVFLPVVAKRKTSGVVGTDAILL
jgi:hypothetical protein